MCQFFNWAPGAWEISGVFQASTGVPFTPGFAGDALGVLSTDPSIAVPDLVPGAGCRALVNPRNPNHYVKTQCFAVPTAPNQSFFNAHCDAAPLIGPTVLRSDFLPGISDAFICAAT